MTEGELIALIERECGPVHMGFEQCEAARDVYEKAKAKIEAAEREQIAAHLAAIGLDDAAQDVLLRNWPNVGIEPPKVGSNDGLGPVGGTR